VVTDYILEWNEVALEANRVSHTDGSKEQNGPTLSSRALAIVHLAMYDAYAGAAKDPGNLPPYDPTTPAPPTGATTRAAIGGAAWKALTELYPSQAMYFDKQLAMLGDKSNSGHDYGVDVAKRLLSSRSGDPSASQGTYRPKKGPGRHRVDPDNPGQGFHGPFYGTAKTFASTKRHDLDAPPKLNSAEYLAALKQVQSKGIKPELMGTLSPKRAADRRTAEETLIGIYWGYDGAAGLGTPPRLYNQIVREIAKAQNNSEADNARLFAFLNCAMGDAGILCWEQKYLHDFWRPVLGIREHDKSLGMLEDGTPMPASHDLDEEADPSWLPLGAPSSNSANTMVMTGQSTFPFANAQFGRVKNFTPPFPAYPSGHATFGAAALHITRLFFKVKEGDRNADNLFKNLFFVSEEFNEKTQDNNGTVRPLHRRGFPKGLWQMIMENGLSRTFLGVHWTFDAFAVDKDGKPDIRKQTERIGGVPLGLRIAEDIFKAGGKKAPKKSFV
jgi:vanadium chloroperoxidase